MNIPDRLPTLVFSLAALVAAAALLAHTSTPASAQFGPAVTGGEAPWVTVAGSTTTADEIVYTVPADRVFVMTGMCFGYSNYTNLSVDEVGTTTTRKVAGIRNTCTYASSVSAPSNFLTQGNARIPFAPGTGVRIVMSQTGVNYTIQGYLAAP